MHDIKQNKIEQNKLCKVFLNKTTLLNRTK